MTRRATDGHVWIQEICRRFSTTTGWPLDYMPTCADEAAVTESVLQNRADCCWVGAVRADQQIVGYLAIGLPDSGTPLLAFSTACDLADILAELLSQVSIARETLRSRTREISTLVDISLSVPKEEDVFGAVKRLLRAAIQLTGFRSAGFFLLNPDGGTLQLRASYFETGMLIRHARRCREDSPPDFEAFRRDRLLLRRARSEYEAHWLPDEAAIGMCFAVQSETTPLGTLWFYDRRSRTPADREAHMLASIASQSAAILERVILGQESQTKQRLQRELDVASAGQCENVLSRLPQPVPFDAAGICTSRAEVGGDLCELLPLDEHRTIVAVGDASGHSVPAALVMSAVRGALRGVSLHGEAHVEETEGVMETINRALLGMTPAHQFMSLLYGILDTRQRCLTYTNAGHPNPILARHGHLQTLDSHGMLLGVNPTADYSQSHLALEPGDVLVFYTDGISEAMSGRREMFHSEGIAGAVRECLDRSAETILHCILSRLQSHTDESESGDDRTLLVVQVP